METKAASKTAGSKAQVSSQPGAVRGDVHVARREDAGLDQKRPLAPDAPQHVGPAEAYASEHAAELARLWREMLGQAECDGCELYHELVETTGRYALMRLGLGASAAGQMGLLRLQQRALEIMARADPRMRLFAYGRA